MVLVNFKVPVFGAAGLFVILNAVHKNKPVGTPILGSPSNIEIQLVTDIPPHALVSRDSSYERNYTSSV